MTLFRTTRIFCLFLLSVPFFGITLHANDDFTELTLSTRKSSSSLQLRGERFFLEQIRPFSLDVIANDGHQDGASLFLVGPPESGHTFESYEWVRDGWRIVFQPDGLIDFQPSEGPATSGTLELTYWVSDGTEVGSAELTLCWGVDTCSQLTNPRPAVRVTRVDLNVTDQGTVDVYGDYRVATDLYLNVHNDGEEMLVLESISMDPHERWQLLEDPQRMLRLPVEPQAETKLHLRFTAEDEVPAETQLTFSSNDPDQPSFTVNLRGLLGAPMPENVFATWMALEGVRINANQMIGLELEQHQPFEVSLFLHNESDVPVTVGTCRYTGPGSWQPQPYPQHLPAGEILEIKGFLTVSEVGTLTAQLQIEGEGSSFFPITANLQLQVEEAFSQGYIRVSDALNGATIAPQSTLPTYYKMTYNGWNRLEYVLHNDHPGNELYITNIDAVGVPMRVVQAPTKLTPNQSAPLIIEILTSGTNLSTPKTFELVIQNSDAATGRYSLFQQYTTHTWHGTALVYGQFRLEKAIRPRLVSSPDADLGSIQCLAFAHTSYQAEVSWYLNGELLTSDNPYFHILAQAHTLNHQQQTGVGAYLQDKLDWHGHHQLSALFSFYYTNFHGQRVPAPQPPLWAQPLDVHGRQPNIDLQPQNQTGDPGDTVTFEIAASGYSENGLRYQWFRNGVPLTDHTSVSGSSTTRLQITAQSHMNGDRFFCQVTNPAMTYYDKVFSQLQVDSQETVLTVNNLPPQATDNRYTVRADVSRIIPDPLFDDSDPENDPLYLIQVGLPRYGILETVQSEKDGITIVRPLVYHPPVGFTGEDEFDYLIRDSQGHTATAKVTIPVVHGNDRPIAANDHFTLLGETLLDILTNDSGNNISLPTRFIAPNLWLTAPPRHGTLSLSENGELSYLPDDHFVGEDQFRYRISDQSGNLAEGTVTLTLPATQPDTFLLEAFEPDQDPAFLRSLWSHIFAEEITDADITYHGAQLADSGRGPWLADLFSGGLFKNNTGVFLKASLVLKETTPLAAQIASWRDRLRQGEDLASILDTWRNHESYQLVWENLSESAFVAQFHPKILGREGEVWEKDLLLQQLQQGSSRFDLILDTLFSEEAGRSRPWADAAAAALFFLDETTLSYQQYLDFTQQIQDRDALVSQIELITSGSQVQLGPKHKLDITGNDRLQSRPVILQSPQHAQIVVPENWSANQDADLIFMPESDFIGEDQFTYLVGDTGFTAEASVTTTTATNVLYFNDFEDSSATAPQLLGQASLRTDGPLNGNNALVTPLDQDQGDLILIPITGPGTQSVFNAWLDLGELNLAADDKVTILSARGDGLSQWRLQLIADGEGHPRYRFGKRRDETQFDYGDLIEPPAGPHFLEIRFQGKSGNRLAVFSLNGIPVSRIRDTVNLDQSLEEIQLGNLTGAQTASGVLLWDDIGLNRFHGNPVADTLIREDFESGLHPAFSLVGSCQADSDAGYWGRTGLRIDYQSRETAHLRYGNLAASQTFRMRFMINLASLIMADGDHHLLAVGRDQEIAVFRFEIRFLENSGHAVRIRARLMDGSEALGLWLPIEAQAGFQAITIDWNAALGAMRLQLGGGGEDQLVDLDNNGLSLDHVLLGLISALDPGTRGSVLFDQLTIHKLTRFHP